MSLRPISAGLIAVAATGSAACGGDSPSTGFTDASDVCRGCAHVVRGLVFVRELIVVEDKLYVADTDGRKLLRVDPLSEELEVVSGNLWAYRLSATEDAVYFVGAEEEAAWSAIYRIGNDEQVPRRVAPYAAGDGTFLGASAGHPWLFDASSSTLRSVGPGGVLATVQLPSDAFAVTLSASGELAYTTADGSVHLAESPTAPQRSVALAGRVLYLKKFAGIWVAAGTTVDSPYVLWEISGDQAVEFGVHPRSRGEPRGRTGSSYVTVDEQRADVWRVWPGSVSLAFGGIPLSFSASSVAVYGQDVFVGGHGLDKGQVFRVHLSE